MAAEDAAGVAGLLAKFPKTRPPLTPQIQAIYKRQYEENRSGRTPAASAAQRLESWMHRRVAADLAGGASRSTLELGAGTLNQLPYERFTTPYDIVEPFHELYANSPERGRIRQVFADIAEVPSDRKYERITSVAAMEHICDLPLLLARAARLLTDGGSFRVAYPAEGGLLWTLGWMATTGLEFRLRHGLDYGVLMRHEHVNRAAEIEALIGALFGHVRTRSFGLGRQLSLYRFTEARRPNLALAAEWEARFQPATAAGRASPRRKKPAGSSSR